MLNLLTACSPMCSDLDECTGENSSDCCNNIDNGMCVLDCQPPRDYITDDSVCGKHHCSLTLQIQRYHFATYCEPLGITLTQC